jgi:hypothetical protein
MSLVSVGLLVDGERERRCPEFNPDRMYALAEYRDMHMLINRESHYWYALCTRICIPHILAGTIGFFESYLINSACLHMLSST